MILSPSRLARYFYHDCERHLLFHSASRQERAQWGLPELVGTHTPLARALMDAGYAWEEQVVGQLLAGRVEVADGPGPLRDRVHSVEQSQAWLSQLPEGRWLYQPTLRASRLFAQRYGLEVTLPDCRPDLLRFEQGRLQVLDVKASDVLKASHKIQVAFYALLLRDLVERPVDLETGWIWLYQQPEPQAFSLGSTVAILESFFRDELPAILASTPHSAFWHLNHRCEWCELFEYCRDEAQETSSVSLLPDLTHGGRRFLRDGGIESLEKLVVSLERGNAQELLKDCGSLRGRARRLRNSALALLHRESLDHGGSSLRFPKGEHVRVVLNLQKEPVSGRTYAAGFLRSMGKDVYGQGAHLHLDLARNAPDCERVRRDFVTALHGELQALHDYNQGRAWREQKSLQVYAFDTFERDLFEKLLFESLEDEVVAPLAAALLFHFQSESLATASEHPRSEVPFPIVCLVEVMRELVALPTPLVVQLEAAAAQFPNPRYQFEYRADRRLSYQLSNAVKSESVLRVWDGDARPLAPLRSELERRLRATSNLIDGLRVRLEKRLFAWPKKFLFAEVDTFAQPELSQLAFVIRYESFMGALALREKRARPLLEKLREGSAVSLQYEGGNWWRVLSNLDDSQVETNTFCNWLLVPSGAEGERAQMAFDDYRQRSAFHVADGLVRLAALVDKESGGDEQLVTRVRLDLKTHKNQPDWVRGDKAVLHARFTDFTSNYQVERLRAVDQPGSLLVALLRHPHQLGGCEGSKPSVPGLTASQQRALEHMASHRLTLVWGPPGTGKTHFLAHAIHALVKQRPGFRVAVTAFTHAAIDNLLRKLEGMGHYGVRKLTDQPVGEQVVGGTVYGFRKALKKGQQLADLLIVDEGSQMKWGELAMATAALREGGQLVIAGDDLQLPPIINGRYPEREDGLPALHDSVFAYLRARDDPARPYTFQLVENWRMNACLSSFSAEALYGPDYVPAEAGVAEQRLAFDLGSSRLEPLLDPDYPLVVCILEDIQAAIENTVEADLVAELATELRGRVEGDDREFWRKRLFVVSPHRLQIRAIHRALAARRQWSHVPFVDTVDKMQGQESDTVIVSYGVSDSETALQEAEFLYSLNRLNVSVTRARSKCIVFLPRPLLRPSFELLSSEPAARGLGHMHALIRFCNQRLQLDVGTRLTVCRRKADPI